MLFLCYLCYASLDKVTIRSPLERLPNANALRSYNVMPCKPNHQALHNSTLKCKTSRSSEVVIADNTQPHPHVLNCFAADTLQHGQTG
jgi:hypothetical protein